ncbi:glycosyltransferase family 4 protein [Modicisalibacter luteus]|uniref:Glycosyltransferase family 4 protein n=1 Tax=Modicisalibacter luteus TaxID=453962 RepID=A0ABV7M584_9GAMM|nr:glycosyltransferase family 4 protein [Halomonas lutea]GHA87917.1 hypothetical protein GCM10007159_06650 [Halomonas lutea]
MPQQVPKLPMAAIAIRQVEKHTGASRIAFHQMSLLKEAGYRVVVLAEKANRDLIDAHGARLVSIWRWPFKGSFRRRWFDRRVQVWRKRHKPSLFISHGDATQADVVFMHNCVHLASQRINGISLPEEHEVASVHDLILSSGGNQRVVANSWLMANEFNRRYGIEWQRLEVNYPGYDETQFNPQRARSNRQDTRYSLGVADDDYLIGLVTSGNFKKRNVAGFVRIAERLDERLPGRCRFLVVGKDDAVAYQRLAKDKGLAERFIWRSTVPDVESIYGALDLFVLPAHIEEFGCVVIEAMACATPVVVSSWTGAGELLQKDYPNLIMNIDEPDAWASQIESVLTANTNGLGTELASLAQQYSHRQQYEKLGVLFKKLTSSEL